MPVPQNVCEITPPPPSPAHLLFRYSTSEESAMTSLKRVMTTPQGTGAPTNLCPLTDTLPMGLRKVTMGACRPAGQHEHISTWANTNTNTPGQHKHIRMWANRHR
eukprot:1159959-Pelagomonas_calceolata.AAC.3